MSLPKYSDYKDSGDAWLGEIPIHWNSIALSRVLACPITDGPHSTPIFQVEGIPFLSVDGIQDGELIFDGCRFISENDHLEFSKKALPKRDDILIGKAASVGKIARVKVDIAFNIWSPLALIRLNTEVSRPDFIEYVLRSNYLQAQIETKSNSNTQMNIGMKDIPKLKFCFPPLPEQTAIAAFLDRETGKIDALIAEQEKLLTLLAEKRQATISHAVTKGLNPNVPMKDSGVEWLGEVPEHWEVKPVKYFSKIGNGSTPNRENTAYWSGGLFPWLNSSTVNQDLVTESEQFVTPLALKECHLPIIKPPAILIGITGQGRTRGMAATLGFEATINQHVAYVKPDNNRVNIDFLRSVFDMAYQHLRTESDWGGSTKGAITCDQIARLAIPLPNHHEQLEIVQFLNKESNKIDALTTEAIHSISLMKERRSALISAAVTGKIDVRCATALAEAAALA